MKKITSLIILVFCSLFGYGQVIEEGFENGLPNGWIVANSGIGSIPWTINNAQILANSGTSSLMVAPETGSVAAPIRQWVITSVADLDGLINPKLSFYGKISPAGPTRNSKLEVRISTTNTNLTSFTTLLKTYEDFNAGAINPISPVGGEYGFQEIDLLPYIGQNVYIAFVMVNQGVGKTWYLDDISVFEHCPEAIDLGVNDVGANAATATWLNPGGALDFQVELLLANQNPTSVPTFTSSTTSTTQILSNLQPNTSYKYYVRSKCTNNVFGDWIGPFVFETNPLPVALPYLEGFEGAHGWRFTNGNQINKWVVGSAVQNGGVKSLYISNDEGVSNVYTINTNSITHAYRDVIIPAGVNEITFSFDFKGQGQANQDYLRFWSAPVDFLPTAGTGMTTAGTVGLNQIESAINLIPNFTAKTYTINVAAYAGTTRRFIFEWRNNNNAGTQGPAAIDNINVSVVPCSMPSNLILGNVTQQTIDVSWTAPVYPPNSYEYYISQNNTAPTDTTVASGTTNVPSATIGGLIPGTTYYIWIRSNCGPNGKSQWLGYVVGHTLQIPAVLPYTENFEAVNNFQFSNNLQSNYWIAGNATQNGGTKSLYITNDGQANSYNITESSNSSAFRDIAIPVNSTEINIQFDFKGMGQTTLDRMRVWLVPTTFVPTPGIAITTINSGGVQVGLVNYVDYAGWTTFNNVVNVTNIAGSSRRVIFEWANNNSVGTQPPAAIDNLYINVITCEAPTGIVLNSVNTSQANLSWTAPAATNVASYDYYLSTNNTTPAATQTPTGNTTDVDVDLDQLTTATQYYFWVRSNCGQTDGTSFWLGPFPFSTTQIPAQLPYVENFDSANLVFGFNNGDESNKWIVNTATAFSPNKSLYISNGNDDYNYTITTASVVHAYRDLILPVNQTQFQFNFVYKGVGESTNDYMRVWIVPATFNLVPGTQITAASGGYQVGGAFVNVPNYNAFNYEFAMPTNLVGQTVKLVFEWRNNATNGSQPPASVDNISFKSLTCPAPTNISAGVTCADASIASITWTPGGTETIWEYVVLPIDSPTPSSGNIVNQPQATYPGLLPLTGYTVWVRAICGDEAGKSPWVSKTFSTAASPVAEANPFCAGPEGILFDNVYNDQGIPNATSGNFHCLGSTPNPVWYYLQVDQAGQLDFQIVQNTQFNAQGQPVGTTLDVDFIAFGPFNNLNEACADIIIETGSPNPASLVVDCSYSAAAVENFSIVNGQPGQVYAILITNYNGQQGKIKLVQTNAGLPGAGNTDCNFLCEVDLGEDKVICGNEYELKAQISTVGTGDVTSIEWYFNGNLMDPTIYNTLNIIVNQSGVYSVIIEKENCLTDQPITDSVEIVFVHPYAGNIPDVFSVCDVDNDGIDVFDLNSFTESFINGDPDYSVTYHANITDANTGFGVLQSPFTSVPTTIFIRIANTQGVNCARVVELSLELKETVLPIVEFDYDSPICVNGFSSIVPNLTQGFTLGGTFTSTTGLIINTQSGEIDLDNSLPGVYKVKYDFKVSPDKCGDSVSHETEIRVLDRIGFSIEGYCNQGEFFISAKDILGTLNFETSTFKWSNNVISSNGAIALVDKVGVYSLTVTTAEGCLETVDIVIDDVYCQIQRGVSPNGDGLNDSFELTNLNVQKLSIFNRYGIEVYTYGAGYTNQWHGQSTKGEKLPSGTYFYTIVTPFETFTGWIQLTQEMN